MVGQHSLKLRFLSLFVTVFVCLNGAGAACVAYCQTKDSTDDTVEHCPLKKVSKHCDPKESFAAVENGDLHCCPMTVSLFAAPLEKHSFSQKQATPAAQIKQNRFSPYFCGSAHHLSTIGYRGPPPLDRRPDRIKNRLLLI